jgi:hypothetical protein
MIDDGLSDAELNAWLARLNSMNPAVDHFAECRRAAEVVEELRRTRACLKVVKAAQTATRERLDRMSDAVAHAVTDWHMGIEARIAASVAERSNGR